MHRSALIALAAAGPLVVPAAAGAHVTLQPKQATAGAYTVQTVRVPNEKDDASTTKVDVRLPDGFTSVSYQKVPGWKVKLTSQKLATPITTGHGEKITEQVTRVTFTADGRAGRIAPGQFQDFPLSVQIPEAAAGKSLTFKAVQTYDDGDVVRWIGGPDSDTPAPTIEVAAAREEGHGTATAGGETTAQPAGTAQAAAVAPDEDSNGLAIAALIAGALGLLAGAMALVTSRRRA